VYIGKLMVLPDYQNQGVGKRLLKTIESKINCKRFELFTGFRSKKNIAVYEKCGYKIFKTEKITPELSLVYLEKHVKLEKCSDSKAAKNVG
jgi:GNAT superfamily N-acetyltransferase